MNINNIEHCSTKRGAKWDTKGIQWSSFITKTFALKRKLRINAYVFLSLKKEKHGRNKYSLIFNKWSFSPYPVHKPDCHIPSTVEEKALILQHKGQWQRHPAFSIMRHFAVNSFLANWNAKPYYLVVTKQIFTKSLCGTDYWLLR